MRVFASSAPRRSGGKLLGFEGITVTKPKEVGPPWDRAFAADKPVLLEFHTDPQIPPLPPHVKPAQMKKSAKALFSGDEDAIGFGVKGSKGKLAEVKKHLPGAGS